jgi:hypothetical protein
MWEKRCKHRILVSKPEALTNHLKGADVSGKIMLEWVLTES